MPASDPDEAGTGKRIKTLREEFLDITQQEFTNRCGGAFERGALGNWERGEGIKTANVRIIAKEFGVRLNWLLTGEGAMFDEDAPREPEQHIVTALNSTSRTSELKLADDFVKDEFRIQTTNSTDEKLLPEMGQRIRAAREARGWTQKELAERSETNQPTIDRLERGVTQNSRYLKAVCSLLNITDAKPKQRTTIEGVYKDDLPSMLARLREHGLRVEKAVKSHDPDYFIVEVL